MKPGDSVSLVDPNILNAKQLLALLDKREFTPEQLDKIIPHTKDFLADVKEI